MALTRVLSCGRRGCSRFIRGFSLAQEIGEIAFQGATWPHLFIVIDGFVRLGYCPDCTVAALPVPVQQVQQYFQHSYQYQQQIQPQLQGGFIAPPQQLIPFQVEHQRTSQRPPRNSFATEFVSQYRKFREEQYEDTAPDRADELHALQDNIIPQLSTHCAVCWEEARQQDFSTALGAWAFVQYDVCGHCLSGVIGFRTNTLEFVADKVVSTAVSHNAAFTAPQACGRFLQVTRAATLVDRLDTTISCSHCASEHLPVTWLFNRAAAPAEADFLARSRFVDSYFRCGSCDECADDALLPGQPPAARWPSFRVN